MSYTSDDEKALLNELIEWLAERLRAGYREGDGATLTALSDNDTTPRERLVAEFLKERDDARAWGKVGFESGGGE